MKSIHLLFIFGTRPEAIKLAPVILEAQKNPEVLVSVCFTGQHKDMVRPILNLFKIKPDVELQVMTKNQSLSELSAAILRSFGEVIADFRRKNEVPDWILVQGDTTSAMVASLVGFYEKIKIAHVEAGLRTESIYSPWPEELNRRVIGLMADLHFAPTAEAQKALLIERKPADQVILTGNTGIDALKTASQVLQSETSFKKAFHDKFSFLSENRKFILATVHRRENFGVPMENILRAILKISKEKDVEILIPVHMNPNVRESVKNVLGNEGTWINSTEKNQSKMWLCEPLDYLDFVYLMQKSHLIISDSGGVQEEAPSLGKPVLVVRKSTERPEAVTAGANLLVGTEENEIVIQAKRLLQDQQAYQHMSQVRDVYGDGQASVRILKTILASSHPEQGGRI